MKRSFLMLTGCALMFTACTGGENPGSPDGGGGGDGGGGNTGPTTLTVSGKVMDADGKPLANASVLVLGKAAVTSDASGAFSVTDVKAPYDIVAVNGGKQSAIVYKGVTRKDPTLSIPAAEMSSGPEYATTVTGKVTGARPPSSTVSEPEVIFESTSSAITRSSFKADSTYSAKVDWDSTTSISGSLFVLQGDRAANSPDITRYTGFGRRDNVTLGNGTPAASQDITLNAVSNSTLTGTVTVPEGHSLASVEAMMDVSPELNVQVAGDRTANFNFPVPVVAQTTFSVSAFSGSPDFAFSIGSKQGIAAGTSNVLLNLKSAPSPQKPDNQAAGVGRSTDFSWSATQTGGVNLAVFTKKLDIPEPLMAAETPFSITVVTTESRTSIPDLSALGMALPASTDFTWRVQYASPVASVDSLLVNLVGSSRVPAGQTEFYYSASAAREFKTAATP